jgi:hypothetical protein
MLARTKRYGPKNHGANATASGSVTTVHDLDDRDHGAVHELRGWRHVRLVPQPVEGDAIGLLLAWM